MKIPQLRNMYEKTGFDHASQRNTRGFGFAHDGSDATLANNVGADMTLVIGATLSASTFGSHACFYSDATVLTAQATGCTPMQHALTQIPYALLAAGITVMGFLALAWLG